MLRWLRRLMTLTRGGSASRSGPRRATLLLATVLLVVPFVGAVDPACAALRVQELYGVEIVLEGQSWDELSLAAVSDGLSRLPSHVVEKLESPVVGRLHILCNRDGRSLAGTAVYPEGANFYYNSDGYNEVILYPDQGPLTVLHELGHAYQMRNVPPSKYAWAFYDEDVRDFMRATGWELVSSEAEIAVAVDHTELEFSYSGPPVWQVMSNPDPLEDYANSFALFFYGPEQLRDLSPVRYDWMLWHVGIHPQTAQAGVAAGG